MCTFSFGHLFLVCIFYQLHLRRMKSTLVIWYIAGKSFNWLNFIGSKTLKGINVEGCSFPSLGLWSFFYQMVKFIVSIISLPSIHLFVCFHNSRSYCCQQMWGTNKKCTVITTLCNHLYISWLLLEYIRKYLVNKLFYSSTLEGALCTQNLKFIAFSSFLGHKDQQRTTTFIPSIFRKTPLLWQVYTTNMYEWSMSSIKAGLLICDSLLANSLFWVFFKGLITIHSKISTAWNFRKIYLH